jgi:hypothetical protein
MHLDILPGILRIVLAIARKYKITGIRLPLDPVLGWNGCGGMFGFFKRTMLTSFAVIQARKITAANRFYPDRFNGVAESGRLGEGRSWEASGDSISAFRKGGAIPVIETAL